MIDYDEVIQHIYNILPDAPCNCEHSEALTLWLMRVTEILSNNISVPVHVLSENIMTGNATREEASIELEHIETVATKTAGITKVILSAIESLNADD